MLICLKDLKMTESKEEEDKPFKCNQCKEVSKKKFGQIIVSSFFNLETYETLDIESQCLFHIPRSTPILC